MIMNNPEKALDFFNRGMNCSQSILMVYGPLCGLDEETCKKIASPFGGGIGHLQEICGAVSGAIMALGLKHGAGSESREVRDRINDMAQDLVRKFKARNSTIMCRDLLGFDITTKSGLEEARKRGVFSGCGAYVTLAAEILETML
jgi:C_GCAxxG_C_C family probable redox protein